MDLDGVGDARRETVLQSTRPSSSLGSRARALSERCAGFLGPLAVGNFLSQFFVDRSEFRSSLRDPSIEFARDMFLFPGWGLDKAGQSA